MSFGMFIRAIGFNKAQKKIRNAEGNTPKKLDNAVEKTARRVEGTAKRDVHVLSGKLKKSIHSARLGFAEWGVGDGVDYGIFEEFKPGHEWLVPAARRHRNDFKDDIITEVETLLK